ENVHSYYGTSHILKGINLFVRQGEIVTLLGRNGAGKTTTLKTIMGLLRPREGNIIFQGENIIGLKPFQIARKGIAYVPEERAIFVHLTVLENLEIALVGKRKPQGRMWSVQRVFDRFPGLAKRAKSRGGTLSGGEQQMLSIARALMSDPNLLLLDEPCEGLAPLIVEEVQRITHEIVREGITVLLVEQNLKMCTALANRHYIMDQGYIVYNGTNQEFVTDEDVKNRYLTLASVQKTIENE
ncbi:MAG: ABC transporter ATP-binding protein, partial [Candidatus Bathyarchaeia archaeon]